MSQGFEREEQVGESVRRLLRDQIGSALSTLRDEHTSPKRRYHEARRGLKKARAVLRLARGAMRPREYRRENERCRDAARSMAGARDAHVLLDTFDRLLEESGHGVLGSLRKGLATVSKRRAGNVESPARTLREALTAVEAIRFEGEGWDAIETGLRETYRRGRRALHGVLEDAVDERFHEWRKSVKYLRHQLQLLEECWREPLKGVISELKVLSDLLGYDHDIAVLRDVILSTPEVFGDEKAVAELVALAGRRQHELRAEAVPLGRRLYVEKPRRFTARIEQYWNAWRVPREDIPVEDIPAAPQRLSH